MPNHKYHQQVKQNGFTLIEILIAIAIFATLSLAAYQILQGVLRSGEISREHDKHLVEIQRGMLLIERDFVQMVARISRTGNAEDEKLQVLYVGKKVLDSDSEGIEFNRLGWTNPLNLLPRSTILRVGYRVKNNQLQRLYYLHPDIVAGEKPEQQVILNDVDSLSFRFWDDDWIDTWNADKTIPKGIEMTINSQHYGELKRVFILSDSTVED
ncbi:type II secretion system minor pseudopilin GspJ [Psychromonas sp. SR45-3]|uniref:type II secretion system minor pseudopilin GspJ n=1 Tax=Psychromonas sp. SR45-3 TaxID=2760930 RepID=UPI0015F8E271|nr:type II secretion system minor pseudopilin GspJ [Psychromonas sp. SR45-3]MBB1273868.1 type II secretion system minor pseudopilin GspJ [Psychromonas sp. SR45-3]